MKGLIGKERHFQRQGAACVSGSREGVAAGFPEHGAGSPHGPCSPQEGGTTTGREKNSLRQKINRPARQ